MVLGAIFSRCEAVDELAMIDSSLDSDSFSGLILLKCWFALLSNAFLSGD